MTRTVTRMFDDYGAAKRAVSALEQAGFSNAELSMVSRYRDDGTLADTTTGAATAADEGSGTATGATIGAAAGAGAGLLAALGMIAIPGIGPLVAAGVLATTLTAGAAGGIAGGLIGALTDYGVSEDEAHVYAEGVRRGSTIVSVRASDDRAREAERILDGHTPVDVGGRRAAYQSAGWKGYDPSQPAYTPEQIRRERGQYPM